MIRKCKKCGAYSLQKTCVCGGETKTPHPPKFSAEDKYGKYRRMARRAKKHEFQTRMA